MSDPASQAEIEDVLSSIRRLVSDEGYSSRATDTVAQPEAVPAPRLVLTPALRVHEAEEAVDDDPTMGEDLRAEEATSGEPTLCESDSAGPHTYDSGSEPDTTEEAAQFDETAFSVQVEVTQDEGNMSGTTPVTDEDAAVEESEIDEAPWRQPGATLYEVAEQIGSPQEDAVPTYEEPVDDDVVVQASAKVAAVVQKIAELEAKVGQAQDQWEPDGASKDPYSGTNLESSDIETLEWQDHVDESADLVDGPAEAQDTGFHTDAEAIAARAATDEALDALDEDGGFLDEESLRELVADIVREELQGALGERITRNVRKLVRREIHRALAAQDLI